MNASLLLECIGNNALPFALLRTVPATVLMQFHCIVSRYEGIVQRVFIQGMLYDQGPRGSLCLLYIWEEA